jgi:hypothetical protein
MQWPPGLNVIDDDRGYDSVCFLPIPYPQQRTDSRSRNWAIKVGPDSYYAVGEAKEQLEALL